MCTAEMCTSLIVASLPGLKVLITRTIANHHSHSTSGYSKPSDNPSQPTSRVAKISARLALPRTPSVNEPEFEMVTVSPTEKQNNGKQVTPARSMDFEGDQIVVKQDFTVELGEDGKTYSNPTSLPFV